MAPSTTCSVRVRSSPCSVSARRFVVGPVGRTRACVGFVSDCADALLGLPKTLRQARATQQGPWARSGDSPTSEPSGESSGTHRALPGSDLPTQVPCHCSVRVRSSPCSVSARRFVVGPVGRTRACVGFVSDCADALLGLPKTLRQARATQQGPWARSGDSPTSEPSGESSGTHRALPGSDLPTQVPCHPWGLISTTTWCVPSDSPPSSVPSKDRRGICESHPEKSPVGGELSCTLGPHHYIIPPLGV